jgi:plasmid stabilization system protein ParE
VNRTLIVRSAAEKDLTLIHEWYEIASLGLGTRFITCVDASLALIERFPEIGPVFHLEYRRLLIRKFPYGIFYIFRPEFISVGAVFHLSRDPDWIKRELESHR